MKEKGPTFCSIAFVIDKGAIPTRSDGPESGPCGVRSNKRAPSLPLSRPDIVDREALNTATVPVNVNPDGSPNLCKVR